MTSHELLDALLRDARHKQKRGLRERLLIGFLTGLFLTPLQGLAFMLAVGIVHHEWWPAVPTIGFWWALLAAALLRSALTDLSRDSAKS